MRDKLPKISISNKKNKDNKYMIRVSSYNVGEANTKKEAQGMVKEIEDDLLHYMETGKWRKTNKSTVK